jgi:predicted kinase
MTKLIITRGLPGCGKSTWAEKWVAEDRKSRAEVNRDNLRAMIDRGEYISGVTEPRILIARDASILRLLRSGISVVNSDTNLPNRVVRDLMKLAERGEAEFEIHDMTDVPLETALSQNASRTDKDPLPAATIEDMWKRYIKGKPYPLPVTEPAAPPPGAWVRYEDPDPRQVPLEAIIVDIDGTVALKGARGPFDETRVHEDRPNERVIQVVRENYLTNVSIIFCSGRTTGCYEATRRWIAEHIFELPSQWDDEELFELHMRPEGDGRKDNQVKYELFDRNIRGRFRIKYVLDDRRQVIDMWREIGLLCLDVAGNNF